MSLKLRLSAHEKVVINGAVIQNGDRRNVISVVNPANVLRAKDVMPEEGANTPIKRVYFMIQSILIASGAEGTYSRSEARDALAKLYTEMPTDEARAGVLEAANQFNAEDFYKSLAALRALIPAGKATLGVA